MAMVQLVPEGMGVEVRSSLDLPTILLLVLMLAGLVLAMLVGRWIGRRKDSMVDASIVRAFNRRVVAWLTMTAILAVASIVSRYVVVALFGLLSFWALREFITMTPTRRADHRALFWSFFVVTPLQYVLIGIGETTFSYFATLIPVYASLILPARIAFTGDHKRFLERAAKIQFGLLVCVYSLSFVPALLDMKLRQYNPSATGEEDRLQEWSGESHVGLLFFFVLMVLLGDLLQFTWDKLVGRHLISPAVNGTKTWEGLCGGVISVGLLGAVVQFALGVTPFYVYGAGFMAALVAFMGTCGSLTMSAIKRDRGVRDYGTLVHGHAGILDRIDSLCFAAPVFYYVTRFFLGMPG
ncbi:MAG: phosphatidate cytidylyltransferase [Planctomycetales bacterium]|nr:phosphatidate cytidylyltransferase [Planctomycetales bacterium]